jgi:hypothetical protein
MAWSTYDIPPCTRPTRGAIRLSRAHLVSCALRSRLVYLLMSRPCVCLVSCLHIPPSIPPTVDNRSRSTSRSRSWTVNFEPARNIRSTRDRQALTSAGQARRTHHVLASLRRRHCNARYIHCSVTTINSRLPHAASQSHMSRRDRSSHLRVEREPSYRSVLDPASVVINCSIDSEIFFALFFVILSRPAHEAERTTRSSGAYISRHVRDVPLRGCKCAANVIRITTQFVYRCWHVYFGAQCEPE